MANPHDSEALELLERIAASAPKDDQRIQNAISSLRKQLEGDAESQAEAKQMLEKYAEAYEKLTAPANRIGVFLKWLPNELCLVAIGDTEYVATYDPKIESHQLLAGVRVRFNDAYAIVGVLDEVATGAILKVADALEDGRLRVGGDVQQMQGRLVSRGSKLENVVIKVGDDVKLDTTGRLAIEHFPREATKDYFVEDVPATPWSAIGGQEQAIQLIRDTIEQPLLFPELYAKFDKKPIKGILLYGPPGCGKTLLGKAVAYNLAKEYSEHKGQEVKEVFLHISGPKILNMWLGETERMVREIFATAREKAKEGNLVVIFIDEAESVLRTRSTGRWLNISNTVVPQFCAEMDGMVVLENVVLILTSNRPDYIDPAVLRPERIDRKVKISRPNLDASKQILGIYIHDRLPIEPEMVAQFDGEPSCARKGLIEGAAAHLWRTDKETEFLKVHMKSGATETLYWRDLVSGALLKSVVDRAKDTAIRRAISEPGVETGISVQDLKDAIDSEYQENEIFPKSDTMEDWLKLIDVEPESVSAVKPVRPSKGDEFVRKNVI